jgi:hypothetical protein
MDGFIMRTFIPSPLFAFALIGTVAACGANSQLDKMLGNNRTDGAISSGGNKEEPPTENDPLDPGFVACHKTMDLVGSQFNLQDQTSSQPKECAGTVALGSPTCILGLTFIDNQSVELQYSRSKEKPLFSRNAFVECNGRLIISFARGEGARELHEFTISSDGENLIHVPTGQLYSRVRP